MSWITRPNNIWELSAALVMSCQLHGVILGFRKKKAKQPKAICARQEFWKKKIQLNILLLGSRIFASVFTSKTNGWCHSGFSFFLYTAYAADSVSCYYCCHNISTEHPVTWFQLFHYCVWGKKSFHQVQQNTSNIFSIYEVSSFTGENSYSTHSHIALLTLN